MLDYFKRIENFAPRIMLHENKKTTIKISLLWITRITKKKLAKNRRIFLRHKKIKTILLSL